MGKAGLQVSRMIPLFLCMTFLFCLAGCSRMNRNRQDEMPFMPLRNIDQSLRGLTIDESNDPSSFSGDWIMNEN